MSFVAVIGLIMGCSAAALLIAWGLYSIKSPCFDERQKIMALNAYRLSLFTLVFYQIIYGIMDVCFDGLPLVRPLGELFGLLLATGVFLTYRICTDAFFTRRQRPWVWSWILAVLVLIGVGTSVHVCHTAGYVKDGKLTLIAMIPALGVFFLAQWIATVLKIWYDRRKDRET